MTFALCLHEHTYAQQKDEGERGVSVMEHTAAVNICMRYNHTVQNGDHHQIDVSVPNVGERALRAANDRAC